MPNIESKIMAAALGTIATFAVQKLIRGSWTAITGEAPPDPDDPEASTAAAIAWVAASAVGVAVAQVAVRRFTANRYAHVGSGTRSESNQADKLAKMAAAKANS